MQSGSTPPRRAPGKHETMMAAYGTSDLGERRLNAHDLDRLAMPKGLGPRFPPVKGAVGAATAPLG